MNIIKKLIKMKKLREYNNKLTAIGIRVKKITNKEHPTTADSIKVLELYTTLITLKAQYDILLGTNENLD